MRKRIRVVTPIITRGVYNAADAEAVAGPDTEISSVLLDAGPASIESEYDEMLAVPDTVAKIIQAENDGVDAVIINCMGDPGMKPAREAVSIPVLGPAETTMHVASLLGHKFSVVTVLDSVIPMLENEAKVYGVFDKLASIRVVNIPVLELTNDIDRLIRALVDESVKAVEEDGAHVIIFGCTGMLGFAEAVKKGLEERGHAGIPVLDPIPVCIKVAEALVDLGLRHSKRTYQPPRAKEIVGYSLPVARSAGTAP